jgi:hypothetical protein
MEAIKFDKTQFDLGDVHYTTKHKLELTCTSGEDRIHYVDASCYCTDPSFKGNKVTVEFDVQKAVGTLSPGEYKTSPKYVYIYLDKDEPHYVADPMTGKKTYNGNKTLVSIPINFRAHGDI